MISYVPHVICFASDYHTNMNRPSTTSTRNLKLQRQLGICCNACVVIEREKNYACALVLGTECISSGIGADIQIFFKIIVVGSGADTSHSSPALDACKLAGTQSYHSHRVTVAEKSCWLNDCFSAWPVYYLILSRNTYPMLVFCCL